MPALAAEPGSSVRDLVLLKEGNPGNAAIYAGTVGGAPVIVKDFTRKAALVRLLVGPFSIRRERDAYRALQGLPGVAKLHETGDERRLTVERIDGVALSSLPTGGVSPKTFTRLQELIDELHARGIVHLDLTHRGNVLVTPDGQPWLIDLASAMNLAWLGPLGRLLARRLGFFDRAAVAKWKKLLGAGPLSPQEERDLRWLSRLSHVWLFNRKVRRRRPPAAA